MATSSLQPSATLPLLTSAPTEGFAYSRTEESHSVLVRVLLVLVAILPLFSALQQSSLIPQGVRVLAALLWMLCLLPGIVYLQTPSSRRAPIPFLPVIGVLYGLCYALQVALGYSNQFYRIVAEEMTPIQPAFEYTQPITLAFAGWALCLTAFGIGSRVFAKRALKLRILWVPEVLQRWGFVLLFGGLVVDLSRNLSIPLMFQSLFAFSATLALFGAAILTVLQRQRALSPAATGLFAGGLVVLVVSRLSSGLVSGTAFLAAALLLGRWVGGARLKLGTILGMGAVVALILSMRGIIRDFRREAWYSGIQYSPVERVGIMRKLVQVQVEQEGVQRTVEAGAETIIGRSAYDDLFADIVRRTPSEVPYWGGETYKSLVGIFIPRILWPDKPQMQLGQQFGHRYAYLYDLDTSTSYNFPFLLEFYANFGPFGVYLGMCLVGLIYAALYKIFNNPGQPLEVSLVGIVLFLPLFNIESDFSLIFGGLFLNSLALLAVMGLMRRNIRSTLDRRAEVESYYRMVSDLAHPKTGVPARVRT